jgi:Holliday junction resolvase-like predicted endonuclease
LSLDSLRGIAAVLDVRIDLTVRWRGGELDRMLNAGHAGLQNEVAAWLVKQGWSVFPEVSFAYFGERGSIDLLAWHAPTRTLLIIEIKTELVDISDLLHVSDRKLRLAPRVARDRGMNPAVIATWLVVADTSANRRRAGQHTELLRAAFPARTVEMRRWVASPTGRVAGLSFWANSNPGGAKHKAAARKRVRLAKAV